MSENAPASSPLGAEMTVEEWFDLPDEVEGELVDGRLVEEEVPDLVHEVIVVWLARIVGEWASVRGGIAGASGVKYAVGPRGGRKPDFSIFLPGGAWPPPYGGVRVPPDIAVEIVSHGRRDRHRDRVEKYGEYASFGIKSYWIVDPASRTLEIFLLGDDGRYALAATRATGVLDAVPGCPELVLDLDSLWSDVDRVARSGES
ncbi:MAG: Uma2 family endonuclease [Thermodesulfobacteriota bacterium]